MADSSRKGSFLLSDVRQRSLDGFWENEKTNAQFGWFGGGWTGAANTSRIERLDFANDTILPSIRTNLNLARRLLTAVSTANFGWWVGGYIAPVTITTIDRLEFSNDTAAIGMNTRGPLTVGRASYAAVGNSYFGWIGGGVQAPSTPFVRSTVERINFANDGVATTVRGPLTQARLGLSAAGNQLYGWFMGGESPANSSTVDRIDFANDSPTIALARNPLTVTRMQTAAVSNSNYAWINGINNSSLDRIDFSNDLITPARRGFMPDTRGWVGTANNSNNGWLAGGISGATPVSTVSRLDFSNDSPTVGSFRSPLNGARERPAGVSGINGYFQYPTQGLGTNEALSGHGWFSKGITPTGNTSLVDRIDFNNDTVSATARANTINQGFEGGAVSNSNYGWLIGQTPASSRIERLDFANDSPSGRFLARGTANADTISAATGNRNYGWFTVNFSSSNMERLDFSNDYARTEIRSTIPFLPGANAAGLAASAATGNADYGWFSGSASTPLGNRPVSNLIRLAFDSDTASATVRGTLSGTRYQHAAVSNNNYGWFVGGYQFPITRVSTTLRVDFSNDSPTASSPRGFLPQAINRHGMSGNQNFGWTAGGLNPASAAISNVYRIEYANDLVSASSRGPITTARSYLPGMSNYVKPSLNQQTFVLPLSGNVINGTYGWFIGGSPGFRSDVIRIDFANDSPTSPNFRGFLSIGRWGTAAAGNANYGWVFGGGWGGLGAQSQSTYVDRIDFANDSAASARSQMGSENIAHAAIGSKDYGWVVGGGNDTVPQIRVSRVDRIDWSSDIIKTIRGNLAVSRNTHCATGNAYYGWIANGSTGATVSIVERIDFANDSPTTGSIRGNTFIARTRVAASSNSNYMWISGGGAGNIDRIDFANDSPATASNRVTAPVTYNWNSAAGSNNYGWIAGDQSFNTSIIRFEYANDTLLASYSTRGPLASARFFMSAVSNYVKLPLITNVAAYTISSNTVGTGQGTFGLYAGGAAPGPLSTVDRVDFSNDTATAIVRGPLSAARRNSSGVANSSFGWFGGGYSPAPGFRSTVDRIDFGNDSPATAAARLPMTASRLHHSGLSNQQYGWWAGGYSPTNAFPVVSSVERIDFSNDLSANSLRSNMTRIRHLFTGFGNANFGWFAGGENISSPSSVERRDFSNDSPASSSPRGNMNTPRYRVASVANAYYGWISGGASPGLPLVSSVERVDFSNDLIAPTFRGALPVARWEHSGTANTNYGWFGGGYATASSSRVERIDFSNDSPQAASPRGNLSSGRREIASVGNFTK